MLSIETYYIITNKEKEEIMLEENEIEALFFMILQQCKADSITQIRETLRGKVGEFTTISDLGK